MTTVYHHQPRPRTHMYIHKFIEEAWKMTWAWHDCRQYDILKAKYLLRNGPVCSSDLLIFDSCGHMLTEGSCSQCHPMMSFSPIQFKRKEPAIWDPSITSIYFHHTVCRPYLWTKFVSWSLGRHEAEGWLTPFFFCTVMWMYFQDHGWSPVLCYLKHKLCLCSTSPDR